MLFIGLNTDSGQVYDNQTYKDTVEKTLVFDNVGGKCRIVEEKVSKGRLY